MILLDYRVKKRKKRKIILFCDVSGSMDLFTLMVLQFAHALKRIDLHTEIFFFSTELTRATSLLDSMDFFSSLSSLPQKVRDWGGGTRIGHCLKIFTTNFGARLISRRSIILFFSDGWDRGEIDLLQDQMAHLHRKIHKIIWINPLMGTEGYQPICRGISAAFPYVDYFLPLSSLHDIQLLEKTLEKMIA